MKLKFGLALIFVLLFSVHSYTQEQESAAESAERLKMQLLEVQARESDLRARLQELDESIKPENIERSLAGVGSTRPEELREARRRQLSIQRDGVVAQLQTLETSRTRLETAIANAEALAYQQSARPPDKEQSMLAAGSRYQWMIFGGGGLAVLALGGGGALLYRRNRRKMIP
jgi:chromosome segregation ATPase